MRTYFGDESIQLENSATFKSKIKTYLEQHVKIKVNKHFEIGLADDKMKLSNHASEINFILNGVPEGPIYWEVTIDACKEYHHKVTNTAILKLNKQSKAFNLTPPMTIQSWLEKMPKGN